MAKHKKSSHKFNAVQKSSINFDFDIQTNKTQKLLIYFLLGLASLGFAVYYIYNALKVNNAYGFPLDDPWIHLTFARNLVEYHSFSYFRDEIVTAGSTSPIYTFILAGFFFVIKNEFILSYFLGISFAIASVIFFYKLSVFEFVKQNVFAIIAACIFVVDKWMNFSADMGMETTMYILILLGCAYFYKKRNVAPFAVFLGLILWGRPDGVAFIAAIAIDYFVALKFSKDQKSLFSKNDLIKIGIISSAMIALYLILNLFLAGSLLPNTYNAKLTYYTPEYRSRSAFLNLEVWQYFTSGAYAVLMVGFIFTVLKLLYDLFKTEYNRSLLYVLFILILVFIYWFKLPYAHRFGRYMMPLIPFFILTGTLGFRDIAQLTGDYLGNKKIAVNLFLVIAGAVTIWSFMNYNQNKKIYADECKYISDRQVAAAKWISNNTQEGDIIATHDVGAIGFYCNRKIVDVAGLITPELIDKLVDKNYNQIMLDFMKAKNVTHIAFLQNWYRVVNQVPLFTTADSLPFETMEVYKYIPDKTYILPLIVNSGVMQVQDMIYRKEYQKAATILTQILAQEKNAAIVYFLLSVCQLQMNRTQDFETNIKKAIEIFPEYKDALFQYAYYKMAKSEFSEAKTYFEKSLKIKPNDANCIKYLNAVNDSLKVK
jgi:hypothetical protein